jgi:hypothetical protein
MIDGYGGQYVWLMGMVNWYYIYQYMVIGMMVDENR